MIFWIFDCPLYQGLLFSEVECVENRLEYLSENLSHFQKYRILRNNFSK